MPGTCLQCSREMQHFARNTGENEVPHQGCRVMQILLGEETSVLNRNLFFRNPQIYQKTERFQLFGGYGSELESKRFLAKRATKKIRLKGCFFLDLLGSHLLAAGPSNVHSSVSFMYLCKNSGMDEPLRHPVRPPSLRIRRIWTKPW